MVDFLILLRDWGRETGVSVSVNHLSNLMTQNQISHQVFYYKSDEELLKAATEINASVIMLQVPTFQPETLKKILELNKETTLVVHSTIAFLQVEEGSFDRFIEYSLLDYPNWSICNPCQSEIEGFSAYLPTKFYYLPNTFNGEIKEYQNLIEQRAKQSPKKVSVFCDFRPFKNITTQLTALAIASKEIELEVHLLKPNYPSEIYNYAKRITDLANFKTVWHSNSNNQELQKKVAEMHVGLQVSYTETFSYILFEHMIKGIPTIGSTAVPYASLIPDFNDPVKIAESLCTLLSDETRYIEYAEKALDTALKIKAENDNQALTTLTELLRRSNRWS